MFKNYLKTAWRTLLKNKFYTAINVAGLTLGLAIGMLILIWAQDELSFDTFHKNAKNIYRLDIRGGTGVTKQIFEFGVAPIAKMAKDELPEVEAATRLCYDLGFSLYKYKDKVFSDERAVFADPSLFSMFDFPLIEGNTARPFADDNSIVITKETANKFFGSADPVGKTIIVDDKHHFTVSGVINNIPKNSDFRQLDMIFPLSYHAKQMLAEGHDMNSDFGSLNYPAFLQLRPGASIPELQAKILKIHLKNKPDDTDADYLLQPLSKMHLYAADLGDRGIGTVRIFIAIALLILVIACINYVNLSTARSMLRSKEISMRKIVGAEKSQLFLQFVIETAVLFVMAAVLAIGVAYALMPVFNKVSGKEMVFDLSDYHIWLVILYTIAGTMAASSIYPALLLSSFKPLQSLKGRIANGIGDALFRKILVVGQFAFSIILIIGTIVITSQLNFMRSKDLGYNKEHVFSFWMRDMSPHYDAVRAELMRQPGVAGVTRSSQNIVRFGEFTGSADWEGKDPKQNLILHVNAIDRDFIPFFSMKMIDGSVFTNSPLDTAHFVLNEAAVKEMGIKNPIGKRFSMRGIKGTIIGIVKDFHYASMREKITPAVFYYQTSRANTIYIKASGKAAALAIAAAEKLFKTYNGQYPFSYTFLDDVFDSLYKGESRRATLFDYFSAVAIFISCLGLLGLTTYTAQVRIREIGVRKVLGATVADITGMLSLDFLKLVMIGILIASPVAWYLMNNWLQDFAYRVELHWWMFVVAGMASVLIAFVTISYQAIHAALANPVKSLRPD